MYRWISLGNLARRADLKSDESKSHLAMKIKMLLHSHQNPDVESIKKKGGGHRGFFCWPIADNHSEIYDLEAVSFLPELSVWTVVRGRKRAGL